MGKISKGIVENFRTRMSDSSTEFLKNKKFFITGASGFIGSHLCEFLEDNGACVVGSISRKNFKNKNTQRIVGDVRDLHFLRDVFVSFKPHVIIHLAGRSTVEEGHGDPVETFDTNINGTINIMELSRTYKPEKIIISSTVHVYGSNSSLPLTEEHFPQPSRPYETSKTCADIIAQSYAETYGIPVEIPRFVNVYGPADFNFTRLIPTIIRSILTENKVSLWGGNVLRDYLFIDDVIAAYIALLRLPKRSIEKNRIINFGHGKPISVLAIAKKLVGISGKTVPIRIIPKDIRKNEIKNLYVSISKAKRLLNWEPKVSLTEGLEKTFFWYKEYFTKYDKVN